jgi:hypothetical protein
LLRAFRATRRCECSSRLLGARTEPERSRFCQRPLTLLTTHLRSRARSLSWTKLGPAGAAALAEGLKGNSTLQSLEYAPLWLEPTVALAFLSAPADTFAITSISELISFLPPIPSLPPCVLHPFRVLIRAMLPLTVRRVDRGLVLLCRTGGSPHAPVYLPTSPPCAPSPPPPRSLRYNGLNQKVQQTVRDAAGSGVSIEF